MRAAEALVPFGFTALESEVYAFLLKENPATGYRIAQAIGKPAANTYKAVASLEKKGALTTSSGTEDGDARLATPTPPQTLLDRLGKRYESERKASLDALKKVAAPVVPTPRLTPIHGTESALAAARAMLGAARGHVLLHAHPDYLEALRPEIEAAASEAAVYVLGSETLELSGVEWLPPRKSGSEVVLELAVDTRSGLLAVAAGEGSELAGCAGTDHPFGAEIHRLLAAGMAVAEIGRKLAEDAGKKQIARILDSLDA